jgi:antitoxin (DNA-binding transcriptional repressor) of toxin-antitoxin stability system
MRVVGVRELKAKLSEYLRDVRRGEVFLVTDRDRVVAELRQPGSRSVPGGDPVERELGLLVEAGQVQPPKLAKGDWAWQPAGAGMARGTAAKVLDALREDPGRR